MGGLPNPGDANWGPTLNNYINGTVEANALLALADILQHETGTDPHGDRAYAQSLVGAITAGENQPNGFVTLNSLGKLPPSLVSGGGITNVYDVKASFNATGNGTTDDSGALNAALTAARTAGGGEVWIPDGNYAIGSTLVIGANTWLNLSPGATIIRIANPSVPQYMLANFTSSTTPAAGNILVSGGTWSVGATTQACIPMAFINANFVSVSTTQFVNSNATTSNAILLSGCSLVNIANNLFTGPAPSGVRGSFSTAVIRVESNQANVIPGLLTGVYGNSGCNGITISQNYVSPGTTTDSTGPYGMYSYLAANLQNSGVNHADVLLTGNYANGLAGGPISILSQWTNVTLDANQLVNSGPSISSVNTTRLITGGTNNLPVDNEVWTKFNPLNSASSWSVAAPYTGAWVRRLPGVPDCIQITAVMTPGGGANNNDGTLVATLPAAFQPSTAQEIPATTDALGAGSPRFYLSTAGLLRCYSIASASTVITINATIPTGSF